MSSMLGIATVLITLALVFYTIAVWAERLARYLKPWHLVFFWLGLACDTAGTYAMELISGRIQWTSWHTITGMLAILLMAIHTVWATVVVFRNDEHARQVFHRYSLAVWLFWLVPYLGGMVAGMMGRPLS
jgi:uncharacterized repeat protein (TIGR03987 family)